ncbi:hypothetical protein GW932_01575 [archaeon]|nr:hypothetical protein [archaeon]
MVELIQTNILEYEDYKTEILTEKLLRDFLLTEAISCMSSRFKDPRDFYENILFKIPETKDYKNFKMIYSHLVEFYPHNYLTKKELSEMHNINEQDILAEGSVKLMDTEHKNPPLVRWMIVKS